MFTYANRQLEHLRKLTEFLRCIIPGRPRHRWEDNIMMDLQEVGWGGDWMELAQDRDR